MKILHIHNIRLPTQKAHGLQIMHTCAALAALGHEVTLAICADGSTDEADIFAHYAVPKSFRIQKIPGVTVLSWGAIGFIASALFFSWNARRSLVFGDYDAIYSRDDILVRKGFFYEMHDVRSGYFQRRALKEARGIVTITRGLADYCRQAGVDPRRIIVSPDGVDPAEFDLPLSREACRTKLGLPLDRTIVLYAGHLYPWKGAHTLAEAASVRSPSDQSLPDDALVVFVGGHDLDITEFRNRFGTNKKIMIAGRQPHALIPYYLKAADILVLPNSAKEDISRLYTSPLKLFEYMASGTPIVASNLPSLREVLNEGNSVLCAPDDPRALAAAISCLLDDDKLCRNISAKALVDVQAYTWEKRALAIADFMSKKDI